MYDFKQLSPADFEDLTRDLLQKEWGVRLEAFRTGRDGGVDLRYAPLSGDTTIVQCKHFAGSGLNKLLSQLQQSEAAKVARLAPRRYVLATSVPLTPHNKAQIRAALHPYVQADSDVFGADDLNNLLTRHPDVERSNFKLWLSSTAVLQRVLHNAEMVQTDFEVERVLRRLPLYVQNSAYPRAVEILGREHVVVISGVPGIGKTTLADLLLFAHLEQGYEPVVIKSEIIEAKRLFNRERKQVFYYDDFLGQTFLGFQSEFLGRREDAAILDFAAIVARSKSAKLILTTREHLLQRAFGISERFERERATFAGRSCVLDMGQYGLLQRGRILYNHIYFSDLPQEHRRQLLNNDFYLSILRHRNFNPRLVEWLSKFQNLRQVAAEGYRQTVLALLEQPSQLWRIAFEQQVSEASRSLLLALYALGGTASLEDELRPAWAELHRYRAARYQFSSAAEDWRASLQELEGSFLSLPQGQATFVNPSVKDFFDATLCQHSDHALDVLSSTQQFRPVAKLWALASSEKGGQLRQCLAAQPGCLVEAIERTLDGPSAVKLPTGVGGNYVSKRIDTSFEERLRVVAEMASMLRSPSLRANAEGFVGALRADWEHRVPEFEVLLAAMAWLEADESGIWSGSRLCDDIRALVLETLADESYYLEGFCALSQYADEGGKDFSPSERAKLAGAFEDYLGNAFREDLRSAGYQSELEDLGGRLQSVGDWLGASVEFEQREISEKIDELSNRAEARGETVRSWGTARGAEPAGDEQEVRRLFDGLAEDA